MMNIILIAPPAAGKGTHSALLKEKYELSHISTGDLLREVALTNQDIAEKLSRGELITDEIVFELLENKIKCKLFSYYWFLVVCTDISKFRPPNYLFTYQIYNIFKYIIQIFENKNY